MVGYDYIRGWKWFQLEFMRMQQERIVQEMQVAEVGGRTRKQLADLDAQERKNSSSSIAAHRDQYLAAQKDARRDGKGCTTPPTRTTASPRPKLDAQRYITEASVVQHRSDAAQQQAEYERQAAHVDDLQAAPAGGDAPARRGEGERRPVAQENQGCRG